MRRQYLIYCIASTLIAATVTPMATVRADPGNDFANGFTVVPLLGGALIPAAPRPLTVIGVGGYDENGFLKNPIWGYQWNNSLKFPKVSDVCPDYNRAADWTTALATCTTDPISVDTQKTRTWKGSCTPGHYNWFPVTYEGQIYWEGHSTGATIFQIGGDDDYNVRLVSSDGNLYTADNPTGVIGEFDSDETVDWWGKGCDTGNDWWQCFHAAVDDSDDAARKKMDGHAAIAIGLLTIDGNNFHAFNSAQSELHPLWALLIHTNANPADDTWAFFVRNSGDEGYCGNSQHQVFTAPAGEPQQINVFIPMPGATGLHFLPSTIANESNDLRGRGGVVTNIVTGSGATLTFFLGDPAQRGWYEGELHIRWDVTEPLVSRRPERALISANRIPREPEAEAPVPTDVATKYARLSPQAKELYLQRVRSVAPQPQPSIRLDVQKLNAAVVVGKVAPGSGGRMASVPDPEAAAREQKYIEILNEVSGGH
jgi:hypothetical protein